MALGLAVDDATVGLARVFTHSCAHVGARLFVGRQGIFGSDGEVHAYEFLYRAGRQHALRVDQWPVAAQDRATVRVLEATFGPSGIRSVASDALAFVNFTRAFLVGDLPIPAAPERLVIEVVESVRPDEAVITGLVRLREQGFRIAIDDFVGLTSQVAMLPYADYVKVDQRDLYLRGPELAELAGAHGGTLIAERVETHTELDRFRDLGFTLFQGFYLETPQVLNRTPVPRPRMSTSKVRTLSDLRPRLPQPMPIAG